MSLYQKIKSAITVRQVGEMYGMEPDRHGMVCCPFHSDNHPSMKLNDTYYYCFGCGANGDAIDLTAKLFDLNPRQAARQCHRPAAAQVYLADVVISSRVILLSLLKKHSIIWILNSGFILLHNLDCFYRTFSILHSKNVVYSIP